MIISEAIRNGAFVRYRSDSGKMIRQIETGNIYEEAIDPNPSPYAYEEAEELLPELTAEEQLDILLGGEDE